MRITKSLSESIANQLLSKKKEQINNDREKLKQLVTSIIEKSIPNQVLEFFNNNKEWIRSSDSFRLKSEGRSIEYDYFETLKELPSSNSYNWVSLDAKDYDSIIKASTKISDKKSQLNKDIREVADAIFNLKTFANIEKQFPEAAKLLPKNGNTSLMVNIDKVRELIK